MELLVLACVILMFAAAGLSVFAFILGDYQAVKISLGTVLVCTLVLICISIFHK